MYISSINVNLFPYSKPRASTDQRTNRLFYEQNITNLVKQLTDTKSFLINVPALNEDDYSCTITDDLEFNLYGYYFKVNAGTVIYNSQGQPMLTKTKLYAEIEIDTSSGIEQLAGQDNNLFFEGLNIVTTPTEGENYKSILLYTKTSETPPKWDPNDDGYTKFIWDRSFKISGIDGKYE